MTTYERESFVAAPLSAVQQFHATTDGLEALTPRWMNLRVENVVGPDGKREPETLEPGTEIQVSMRPLGVFPRQTWTSRIVEKFADEDSAYFVDEMTDGPFATWRHTHHFEAVPGGTVMRDTVEYELPGPGKAASPFGIVGLDPLFRFRHRRTKIILEARVDV